jgi:hypothetical protein
MLLSIRCLALSYADRIGCRDVTPLHSLQGRLPHLLPALYVAVTRHRRLDLELPW